MLLSIYNLYRILFIKLMLILRPPRIKTHFLSAIWCQYRIIKKKLYSYALNMLLSNCSSLKFGEKLKKI